MLVDAGGYPVGVIAAPGGKLASATQPEVAQRLEQDGPGGRRLMAWL